MNLKDLDVKQALQLLAEKYPEPVEGWFWMFNEDNPEKGVLTSVETVDQHMFKYGGGGWWKHFSIEVPDEYRYMTQQECLDWVCLHGHKGYQVKHKENTSWTYPQKQFYDEPEAMEYRTIKEIDGKVAYGEPQEFRKKVEQ